VTKISWDVIGLDSNNVNVGPNQFLIGQRVCNTGAAPLSTVVASFFWDSANPYINLFLSPSTLSVPSIAVGACFDFYFNIDIKRVTVAYDTIRQYHFTIAASGETTFSTPVRQVYVEHLISQNRNSVDTFTGPNNVLVGNTYQYILDAHTATQGYESLEHFPSFAATIFQVREQMYLVIL
jgi:hypothetical protein